MFNILHLTTFLHAGAGNVITTLAEAQVHMKFQVIVAGNDKEEPGFGYNHYQRHIETLTTLGISFYRTDSTFKRDLGLNLQAAAFVRTLIDKHQITLIHAHAAIPALVGSLARSGQKRYIPIVQTAHGWGQNKTPEHEFMDVVIMNGLDHIVAVSQGEKDLLAAKGVRAENISVIYNGASETVQSNFDNPLIREIKELKESGFFVIGCVGSICERKNQALLLKAFSQLSARRKTVLILIGEEEEPLTSRLKQEAKDLHIARLVKFYGYQPHADMLTGFFDCFVLPSKSEGLGISAIEAFRAQVPVVLSNIPPFQELVTDQKTGFLFESENAASLLKVLEMVIDLPAEQRKHLTHQAYQLFLSTFTTDAMIKNYMAVYNKLPLCRQF